MFKTEPFLKHFTLANHVQGQLKISPFFQTQLRCVLTDLPRACQSESEMFSNVHDFGTVLGSLLKKYNAAKLVKMPK